MDFENNKNEQCHSNHDIEELDRIRNQVINLAQIPAIFILVLIIMKMAQLP